VKGPEAPRPLFYGWVVVGALGTILFLSAGLGFYALGVFVTPLESEFGWSRGQISVAMTLSTVVSGLMGPVAGWLLGQWGSRRLLTAAAVVTGAGFAAIGLTPALWYLYLAFACMAAGRAGLMMVPASAIVANWFVRRRGLATGVMTAGIGLGGLVMAPAVALLIDAVGWRAAFGVLGGGMIAVALPLTLLIIRQRPSEMGLAPDGDPPGEARASVSPAPLPGLSLRDATRAPAFWAITAALSLVFATQSAILLHVIPYLEGEGIERARAAAVLGAISGIGITGKIGAGYAADRLSPRLVVAAVFVMQACALGLLLAAGEAAGLVLFTALFGVSMGSVVALQPLILADYFGLREFASIMGVVTMFGMVISALGPAAAGFIYDAAGSYTIAFTGFLAIDAVAAALVLSSRRPSMPCAPDGERVSSRESLTPQEVAP
jgi:MFS family permease